MHTPISRSSPRVYMILLAQWEAAMISASVEDSAMRSCLLLPYATTAPAYLMHHPLVEQPICQSLSEYA